MSQIHIQKITLCNFRAFASPPSGLQIDLPQGENLLVYGENGAGKSSLFLALKYFFEHCGQAKDFAPFQNFWHSEPGFIELELSNRENRRWPEPAGAAEPSEVWSRANKVKGAIDYKVMLQTHFVPRTATKVNLFDLLVSSPDALLKDIQNPSSRILGADLTFGENWLELSNLVAQKPRSSRVQERINEYQAALNNGLIRVITDLERHVASFLRAFEFHLEFSFDASACGASHAKGNYEVIPGEIGLNITLFNQEMRYGADGTQFQDVLNEAKLSAMALSIFLASKKIESQSELSLLLLDDVLIGLDMSNRFHVLDLLREHFRSYQIVFLTYDRTWFEAIKTYLNNAKGLEHARLEKVEEEAKAECQVVDEEAKSAIQAAIGEEKKRLKAVREERKNQIRAAKALEKRNFCEWKCIEMFVGQTEEGDDFEIPLVRANQSLLDLADQFLLSSHDKAAGVYARIAFEVLVKEFCENHRLAVRMPNAGKKNDAEDYWQPIKSQYLTSGVNANLNVLEGIANSQKVVLNPSAHNDHAQPYKIEVRKAIQAVRDLESYLQAIPGFRS